MVKINKNISILLISEALFTEAPIQNVVSERRHYISIW